MSQATKVALQALARRSRSRVELVQVLERKGFEADVVREVLTRVDRFGYLDDQKFARDRAETLLRHGRLGKAVVVARLVAAGVKDSEAKAAAEDASRALGVDERAEALALLKSRGIVLPVKDVRTYGRAARALAARGFSEELSASVLGPPDGFSGADE